MDVLRKRVEKVVREVVTEWIAGARAPLSPGGGNPRARPLVVANWKMNHLSAAARAFAAKLAPVSGVDIVICPPAVLLHVMRDALEPARGVGLGAQNTHHEGKGAFTGEHSAAMLRDAGASFVVLGHSERRWIFGETDEDVARKARAALEAGLKPIVCIGERLEEREQGATFRVIRAQLAGSLAELGLPAPDPADLVIAYEPVWAIGTGRTATPAQAGEAIAFIRDVLADRLGWNLARRVRLLYGGSVTARNAGELAREREIDGFLVGGASLCAGDLTTIARAVASRRELEEEPA